MVEMFRYLTGIIEKRDRKEWRNLVIMNLISPVTDLFNFSALIFIVNMVVRDRQASKEIIIFTFFMGMVSALKGLFDLYKCRIYVNFVFDGAQRLSEKLYELLLKEDLADHNQKSPMQALAMVRSDTQSCMNIIVTYTNIWIDSMTMVGYFVVLMYTSKWLGLVSSLAFILFMIVMYFYYRKQIGVYGEKSRLYTIKTNAQVTIAFGNFKEMKIADNANVNLQRYHGVSEEYAQMQKQFQYKKSMMSLLMQNFVMTVMFLILAVFMNSSKKEAGVFLASIVVYLTMLIKMIPTAYSIVSGLNDIKFSQKAYEVIREGINHYKEIVNRERQMENIRQRKLTFHKGLIVNSLTFAYSDRNQVFENAFIEVPAGCSVAIIGVSGSGKTTFLDLVLGLLRPQKGSILYDDYDIVTHKDKDGECKANVGDITSYIPQIVYLNGETICNNVAFFEKKEVDIERVEECLKYAQIWDDVRLMPEGINTVIGENGTIISGGQRQRIALARALYKDFELLIMDEATAALDMETEKAVIDSIRQIKGDKTILLATHHMSLANECDMIYKIEKRQLIRVK